MTCERCGAELTPHEDGHPRSANGLASCPRGGPHRPPSVADGADEFLRSL